MSRPAPALRLMLDLSTAHLPADARDDLNGVTGVHAYRLRYGWLMWVPEDPDDSAGGEPDEVPGWVLAVQRYARRHGCDYVSFDRDAPVDPALPFWPETSNP